MNPDSILSSEARRLFPRPFAAKNSLCPAACNCARSVPLTARRTEISTSWPLLTSTPWSTATYCSGCASHWNSRIPGTSAATQSRRRGNSPQAPSRVRATIRSTPIFSANIPNGSSTLRCMSIGYLAGRRGTLALRLIDAADHVQCALRVVLEFVPQNALTAIERILTAHQLALDAAELFRGKERLRQETLQQARAPDDLAVLGRELLESEHGDDVLQILVLRQRAPDLLRQVVMSFADDARRSHRGSGLQQVHGREQALARPLARQHDGCRKM